MHSRATDRRNASKCQGKWPDQTLDQAFGLPEVAGSGQHLASVLQEGRENANIDAGLGFMWRISVKTMANTVTIPMATGDLAAFLTKELLPSIQV
jgi:hypothetical protein